MPDGGVRLDCDGPVATVTLCRPDVLNAQTPVTWGALRRFSRELPGDVRVVLVRGEGRAFSAGLDLAVARDTAGELARLPADGCADAIAGYQEGFTWLRRPDLVTVAAVQGYAIGAGFQLALACDLRVGAPGAVFAVPTARIGLAVDPWTVHRLAQVAGGGTARALLLACDRIGVELAHARGLVDRLGSTADALALAAEIAAFAPLTLRYTKLALDRTDLPVDDPELHAAFEACWSSADLEEGRRARAERRTAAFTGR